MEIVKSQIRFWFAVANSKHNHMQLVSKTKHQFFMTLVCVCIYIYMQVMTNICHNLLKVFQKCLPRMPLHGWREIKNYEAEWPEVTLMAETPTAGLQREFLMAVGAQHSRLFCRANSQTWFTSGKNSITAERRNGMWVIYLLPLNHWHVRAGWLECLCKIQLT